MRKYAAELLGTGALVFLGCGTAMLVGCDASQGCGYLLTALAFGLAVCCMVCAIGRISGCHINPAVSVGVLVSGGMSIRDFAAYLIAQFFGALAGSAVLTLIFVLGKVPDLTGSFGANGLAGVEGSWAAGLLTEVVLTFLFVLVVLGASEENDGNTAGTASVIGLALTAVHILGIGLTGTSVNPARSFGPAVISAFGGDLTALTCLWVFLVGPMVGGILAGVCHRLLRKEHR